MPIHFIFCAMWTFDWMNETKTTFNVNYFIWHLRRPQFAPQSSFSEKQLSKDLRPLTNQRKYSFSIVLYKLFFFFLPSLSNKTIFVKRKNWKLKIEICMKTKMLSHLVNQWNVKVLCFLSSFTSKSVDIRKPVPCGSHDNSSVGERWLGVCVREGREAGAREREKERRKYLLFLLFWRWLQPAVVCVLLAD